MPRQGSRTSPGWEIAGRPASTVSLPRSPSEASGGAVIIWWNRSSRALASATGLPLTLSVISDAEALEMRTQGEDVQNLEADRRHGEEVYRHHM
jgi:hypothetical protein